MEETMEETVEETVEETMEENNGGNNGKQQKTTENNGGLALQQSLANRASGNNPGCNTSALTITLCVGERHQTSHVFLGVHLGGVVRPQQRQFRGLVEQQWKRLRVGDVPVKDIVFVHRHGLHRSFDGMGGKVVPGRV